MNLSSFSPFFVLFRIQHGLLDTAVDWVDYFFKAYIGWCCSNSRCHWDLKELSIFSSVFIISHSLIIFQCTYICAFRKYLSRKGVNDIWTWTICVDYFFEVGTKHLFTHCLTIAHYQPLVDYLQCTHICALRKITWMACDTVQI